MAGSDTHQAVQYGCIRTDFTKETNRVADLYEEMKAGRYSIKISDYAGFQVKTAGLLKKSPERNPRHRRRLRLCIDQPIRDN